MKWVPEAIRSALSKCKYMNRTEPEIFTRDDLIVTGMWGGPNSAEKRREVGKILGIGYGNCNSFLKKLNQFLISKDEFNEAIHHLGNP